MRILVVEDNPTLGQQLVQGLKEQGYNPELSPSGYDADTPVPLVMLVSPKRV